MPLTLPEMRMIDTDLTSASQKITLCREIAYDANEVDLSAKLNDIDKQILMEQGKLSRRIVRAEKSQPKS